MVLLCFVSRMLVLMLVLVRVLMGGDPVLKLVTSS